MPLRHATNTVLLPPIEPILASPNVSHACTRAVTHAYTHFATHVYTQLRPVIDRLSNALSSRSAPTRGAAKHSLLAAVFSLRIWISHELTDVRFAAATRRRCCRRRLPNLALPITDGFVLIQPLRDLDFEPNAIYNKGAGSCQYAAP